MLSAATQSTIGSDAQLSITNEGSGAARFGPRSETTSGNVGINAWTSGPWYQVKTREILWRQTSGFSNDLQISNFRTDTTAGGGSKIIFSVNGRTATYPTESNTTRDIVIEYNYDSYGNDYSGIKLYPSPNTSSYNILGKRYVSGQNNALWNEINCNTLYCTQTQYSSTGIDTEGSYTISYGQSMLFFSNSIGAIYPMGSVSVGSGPTFGVQGQPWYHIYSNQYHVVADNRNSYMTVKYNSSEECLEFLAS